MFFKKKKRSRKSLKLDRAKLSREPHELRYLWKVAKIWLDRLHGVDEYAKVEIKAGQLKRLCDYILKE